MPGTPPQHRHLTSAAKSPSASATSPSALAAPRFPTAAEATYGAVTPPTTSLSSPTTHQHHADPALPLNKPQATTLSPSRPSTATAKVVVSSPKGVSITENVMAETSLSTTAAQATHPMFSSMTSNPSGSSLARLAQGGLARVHSAPSVADLSNASYQQLKHQYQQQQGEKGQQGLEAAAVREERERLRFHEGSVLSSFGGDSPSLHGNVSSRMSVRSGGGESLLQKRALTAHKSSSSAGGGGGGGCSSPNSAHFPKFAPRMGTGPGTHASMFLPNIEGSNKYTAMAASSSSSTTPPTVALAPWGPKLRKVASASMIAPSYQSSSTAATLLATSQGTSAGRGGSSSSSSETPPLRSSGGVTIAAAASSSSSAAAAASGISARQAQRRANLTSIFDGIQSSSLSSPPPAMLRSSTSVLSSCATAASPQTLFSAVSTSCGGGAGGGVLHANSSAPLLAAAFATGTAASKDSGGGGNANWSSRASAHAHRRRLVAKDEAVQSIVRAGSSVAGGSVRTPVVGEASSFSSAYQSHRQYAHSSTTSSVGFASPRYASSTVAGGASGSASTRFGPTTASHLLSSIVRPVVYDPTAASEAATLPAMVSRTDGMGGGNGSGSVINGSAQSIGRAAAAADNENALALAASFSFGEAFAERRKVHKGTCNPVNMWTHERGVLKSFFNSPALKSVSGDSPSSMPLRSKSPQTASLSVSPTARGKNNFTSFTTVQSSPGGGLFASEYVPPCLLASESHSTAAASASAGAGGVSTSNQHRVRTKVYDFSGEDGGTAEGQSQRSIGTNKDERRSNAGGGGRSSSSSDDDGPKGGGGDGGGGGGSGSDESEDAYGSSVNIFSSNSPRVCRTFRTRNMNALHSFSWDQRTFLPASKGFFSQTFRLLASPRFLEKIDWTLRGTFVTVLPMMVLCLEPATRHIFPLPTSAVSLAFWMTQPTFGAGLRELYIVLKGFSFSIVVMCVFLAISPGPAWFSLLLLFACILVLSFIGEQQKRTIAFCLTSLVMQYIRSPAATGYKYVGDYYVTLLIALGLGLAAFFIPFTRWSSDVACHYIGVLGDSVSLSVRGTCASFWVRSPLERQLHLARLRQLRRTSFKCIKKASGALSEMGYEPHSGTYTAQLKTRIAFLKSIYGSLECIMLLIEQVTNDPSVVDTPLCVEFGRRLRPHMVMIATAMDRTIMQIANLDVLITPEDIAVFKQERDAFEEAVAAVRGEVILNNDAYQTDTSDVLLGFFLFGVQQLCDQIAGFTENPSPPNNITYFFEFPMRDLKSFFCGCAALFEGIHRRGSLTRRMKEAIKLATCIAIAGFFQVYALQDVKTGTGPAVGVDIIALVYKPTGAESFQYAIHRLIGTVLGSLTGLLSVQIASERRWVLYICTGVLSTVGCYVQAAPGFFPLGNALTNSVISIVLQYQNQQAAMSRIQQNCFAILVYFIISSLVWPMRGRTKVKLGLDMSLRFLREATYRLLRNLDMPESAKEVSDDVKMLLGGVNKRIAQQQTHLVGATVEPTMDSAEFPDIAWHMIIRAQEKLQATVTMMQSAYESFMLSTIGTDGGVGVSVHWVVLHRIAPITGELSELMSAAIDIYLLTLSNVTVVPTAHLTRIRQGMIQCQKLIINTFIETLEREVLGEDESSGDSSNRMMGEEEGMDSGRDQGDEGDTQSNNNNNSNGSDGGGGDLGHYDGNDDFEEDPATEWCPASGVGGGNALNTSASAADDLVKKADTLGSMSDGDSPLLDAQASSVALDKVDASTAAPAHLGHTMRPPLKLADAQASSVALDKVDASTAAPAHLGHTMRPPLKPADAQTHKMVKEGREEKKTEKKKRDDDDGTGGLAASIKINDQPTASEGHKDGEGGAADKERKAKAGKQNEKETQKKRRRRGGGAGAGYLTYKLSSKEEAAFRNLVLNVSFSDMSPRALQTAGIMKDRATYDPDALQVSPASSERGTRAQRKSVRRGTTTANGHDHEMLSTMHGTATVNNMTRNLSATFDNCSNVDNGSFVNNNSTFFGNFSLFNKLGNSIVFAPFQKRKSKLQLQHEEHSGKDEDGDEGGNTRGGEHLERTMKSCHIRTQERTKDTAAAAADPVDSGAHAVDLFGFHSTWRSGRRGRGLSGVMAPNTSRSGFGVPTPLAGGGGVASPRDSLHPQADSPTTAATVVSGGAFQNESFFSDGKRHHRPQQPQPQAATAAAAAGASGWARQSSPMPPERSSFSSQPDRSHVLGSVASPSIAVPFSPSVALVPSVMVSTMADDTAEATPSVFTPLSPQHQQSQSQSRQSFLRAAQSSGKLAQNNTFDDMVLRPSGNQSMFTVGGDPDNSLLLPPSRTANLSISGFGTGELPVVMNLSDLRGPQITKRSDAVHVFESLLRDLSRTEDEHHRQRPRQQQQQQPGAHSVNPPNTLLTSTVTCDGRQSFIENNSFLPLQATTAAAAPPDGNSRVDFSNVNERGGEALKGDAENDLVGSSSSSTSDSMDTGVDRIVGAGGPGGGGGGSGGVPGGRDVNPDEILDLSFFDSANGEFVLTNRDIHSLEAFLFGIRVLVAQWDEFETQLLAMLHDYEMARKL